MYLNTTIFKVAFLVALLAGIPVFLKAQTSSINAFSPYSFYGIGDLTTPGNTAIRSMGGAGLGYRSSFELNYLNPATYSAIPQQSALLSMGGEGQNYYLRNKDTKSSYNSFNFRDFGFGIPIAKGLGMAITVSPFSDVGYRINMKDDNPIVGSDIGYVDYTYQGEGGVTQFKGGIGWRIVNGFSIGADVNYYHGHIQRYFEQSITSITGTGAYTPALGQKNEKISSVFFTFGTQVDLISNKETLMTLGATYQLGGNVNATVTRFVPFIPSFTTNGAWTDYVNYYEGSSSFTMPDIISAGMYLHKPKWSIGADYVYSMWGNVNKEDVTNQVGFRNTHTVKVGARFVPNPGDVRSFMNRWTYRAGFRYSNYYMTMKGTEINEKAITFGIGIPLNNAARNKIDLGLELGTRGTVNNGLIKENFFKFSIGFSLFGEDFWFVKYKYD